MAAGCMPILVRTGYGVLQENEMPPGVRIYDDLRAAAESVITGVNIN